LHINAGQGIFGIVIDFSDAPYRFFKATPRDGATPLY